jgi:hypothetical protein
MNQDRERQHGADQDLVRRISEYERAPARERREGLTLGEPELARVKELVTRELDKDHPLKRTQPIPQAGWLPTNGDHP